MIYKNFLFFIIAVVIYTVAPSSENTILTPFEDILSITLIFTIFSHWNRISFFKLKRSIFKEEDSYIKIEYKKRVERNSVIAILLFSVELFFFDLKYFLASLGQLSGMETPSGFLAIVVFLLHIVMVWYWGFRYFGRAIRPGSRVKKYISENIKFNLVILIPWLGITVFADILTLLNFQWIVGNSSSQLFQFIFLLLFLLLFLILSPSLIIRLWNCSEIEDGELKEAITEFGKKNGVLFRKIMYWNSFGKSLITAAVIGFFRHFRYLLITPGLTKLLDRDEMIAVISHETGHVKKKHLLYYLLFFAGFVVMGGGLIMILELLILKLPAGFDLILGQGNSSVTDIFNILIAFISLSVFILYFRYVFGFFMRNFEREADIYCFESGVDPEHLISAFRKIELLTGVEKKGSNWHHYTIGERIEFLSSCSKDPGLVKKHRLRIKRGIAIYTLVLFIIGLFIFLPFSKMSINNLKFTIMATSIERRIKDDPYDPVLYSLLGSVCYEQKKWKEARLNYEKSLALKGDQPEVLNNLAWLLVTCKDRFVRSPKKALVLALKAVELKKSAHIYDTLAEVFLANEDFKNAYKASYRALELADNNPEYYKKQLLKMKNALERSLRTIKL